MASPSDNDDVTITEILARLWRSRVWLLLVPIAVGLAAAAALSGVIYFSDRPVIYYVSLYNVEKMRYPNGARFSPQDLVSAPVLSRVREKLNLPQTTDLTNSVVVRFDSPVSEAITRSYRKQISGGTLSAPEIDAANNAYIEKIANARSTALRIEVSYRGLDVDIATAEAIAREIPAAWEQVYTTQFSTLLSPSIAPAVPSLELESFANASGVVRLTLALNELERGLHIATEDTRLAAIQTPEGLTARDILDQINTFREVYYNAVFASVFQSEDIVSTVYLRNQELQIADLRRQLAGIDQSVERIGQYLGTGGGVDPSAASPGQDFGSRSGIQMDEGALKEIVSLTERASLAAFFRDTLESRQKIINNISSLQKQIDLANLPKPVGKISSDFVKLAYDNYARIFQTYNQLLPALRTTMTETAGSLYMPLSGPSKESSIVPPEGIAAVIGTALFGFLLAALYAVFRRPKDDES